MEYSVFDDKNRLTYGPETEVKNEKPFSFTPQNTEKSDLGETMQKQL